MRAIHIGLAAVSLASAVCLFLVGCGGVVDHETEPIARPGGKQRGGSTGVTIKKREPLPGKPEDYKGVIKGIVKFEDKEPDLAGLTEQLRATMSKSSDHKFCMAGNEHESIQQSYRIGKNKGLGNVFVWIAPPAGFHFNVPDSQLPANKRVVISQPHCAFLPHCVAVFSSRYRDGKQDPTGCQVLVVQNDARVPHNASIKGSQITANPLLPAWSGEGEPKGESFVLEPDRNEITISCSIHTWMQGFVRAFEHPYCAVTSVGANLKDLKKPVWEDLSSDAVGTYELKGVPVGAKVKLFAWHERLGHLLGPNGKDLTISAEAMTENIEAKGQ